MARGGMPRRTRHWPELVLVTGCGLVAQRFCPVGWLLTLSSLLPPRGVNPDGFSRARVRRQQREAVAPTIEKTVSEMVKVADIRECPWEALVDVYQLEARRCWAERVDGKARGFIANLLPEAFAEEAQMSPFEIANLRRQWRSYKPKEDGPSRDEMFVADPYRTLGVGRNSTMAEIKKAYLAKARECHPDKEEGDPELFQEVLLAYRILRDESRKGHYDDTGTDTGEGKQEVQYIRVPDLPVLRQGLLEHDELYLAPGFETLAGQVGWI